MADNAGDTTIRLNGHEARDVILTQSDCAEDFDLAPGESAEPGSVMVIAQDGAMHNGFHPIPKPKVLAEIRMPDGGNIAGLRSEPALAGAGFRQHQPPKR